jgi:hypothetical protein
VICVVTDSDDRTEARDILDAIVAVDRADVPAITQRRALAQSVPRQVIAPSAPTPRCEIPDWFPAVLADAQDALRDAETRQAESSARRAQASVTAADADAQLAEAAAATAPDRDALRHAEARAVEARRRHTSAQHRLDTAPRLHRRGLRRDLDTAQQQLDRAEDYLERTRQRTGPAVERHAEVAANQRGARDELRNCDTIDVLDSMALSVGERRLHVRALTTWQRWAEGDDIPARGLRTAYVALARQPGVEQRLASALRDDLPGAPIDRHPHFTADRDHVDMQPARHDFGIEL